MRRSICLLFCLLFLAGMSAHAAGVAVRVDGTPLVSDVAPRAVGGVTYVSFRSLAMALRPDASVSWEGQAVAWASGLEASARPGGLYLLANGRPFYVAGGVLAEAGRVLVPVRVLAGALGASVDWDPATGAVNVWSGSGSVSAAAYPEDELYWLSRIISAESRGEPLLGKIAVGNVVLNRVASSEFPDTIYGVIFDSRWGGQFEPVRNGAIYQEPTAESVLAAKLCLEGADAAGESLYFLAPALTDNHWTMQNRSYVKTIGGHWFYR